MKTYIYKCVRFKKDKLKRHLDIRANMIWMGAPPRLLTAEEVNIGDVIFCGSESKHFN